MTILSPVDASSYSTFILQRQLERFNLSKLAQDQQVIQATYGQQIGVKNREIDAWASFQKDVKDAQSFLSQTVSRTEELRSKIDQLINIAYRAEIEGISAADSWNSVALQYDTVIKSWNSTANSSGRALNLIGDSPVSDYIFDTDIYGATQRVTHYDLTTGYSILDSGGNTWKKDSDYASLLKQYNAAEVATGEYGAITGGVRLDSLIGTAITFTVSPDTSSATQYTGTLSTEGLAVLDAWVYEDLETTDGRTRAIAALEEAKVTLDYHLGRFKLALTQAEYGYNNSDVATSALQSNISDLSLQQLLALQEVDNQASIRNSSSLALINQAQVVQNEYLNMLGTGTNSKFIGSLINVLS